MYLRRPTTMIDPPHFEYRVSEPHDEVIAPDQPDRLAVVIEVHARAISQDMQGYASLSARLHSAPGYERLMTTMDIDRIVGRR